jgi:hypothetical protein
VCNPRLGSRARSLSSKPRQAPLPSPRTGTGTGTDTGHDNNAGHKEVWGSKGSPESDSPRSAGGPRPSTASQRLDVPRPQPPTNSREHRCLARTPVGGLESNLRRGKQQVQRRSFAASKRHHQSSVVLNVLSGDEGVIRFCLTLHSPRLAIDTVGCCGFDNNECRCLRKKYQYGTSTNPNLRLPNRALVSTTNQRSFPSAVTVCVQTALATRWLAS